MSRPSRFMTSRADATFGSISVVDGDFEDARDLAVRRMQVRARVSAHATIGMKAEAADRDVDRRQRAEDATSSSRQADLFVRFAERGLLECFARLRRRRPASRPGRRAAERAARTSGRRAARRRPGTAAAARRRAEARRVESRRPLAPRTRRHQVLRGRARQRIPGALSRVRCERGLEPHMDICGHSPAEPGTTRT